MDTISFHGNSTTMGNNGPSANNNGQQDSTSQGMTAPFFFLIILVILVAIFFCCNSPCIRRLARSSNNSEPPPQRQRPRSELGTSDVEEGLNRKEFVKSNLPYRTVDVGEDETTSDAASVNRRSSRSLHKINLSVRSIPEGSAEEENARASSIARSSFMSTGSANRIPVCSICLSGFHKGDEVAWSTNPSCNHEYHRDCIHDWLMSHEDCPLCRNVFLPKDVSETSSPSASTDVLSSSEQGDEAHRETREEGESTASVIAHSEA
jgi:hypothetical protein